MAPFSSSDSDAFSYNFGEGEKYSLTKDGQILASKILVDLKYLKKGHQSALNGAPIKPGVELEEFKYNNGNSNLSILSQFNGENSNSQFLEFFGRENSSSIPVEFTIKRRLIESFEIKLLIDNREIHLQRDRAYIHEKILEAGFPCESTNLPLGDFLWIVEMKCNPFPHFFPYSPGSL